MSSYLRTVPLHIRIDPGHRVPLSLLRPASSTAPQELEQVPLTAIPVAEPVRRYFRSFYAPRSTTEFGGVTPDTERGKCGRYTSAGASNGHRAGRFPARWNSTRQRLFGQLQQTSTKDSATPLPPLQLLVSQTLFRIAGGDEFCRQKESMA